MMKALILMTRVPIPGKTKTRLMKVLTADGCAQINECFLLDLFNMFSYIQDDMDIFLTYTPEDSIDLIKDIVPDYIECFPQKGEDLGKRMLNSFRYLFNKGYSKVVLIGSDIPDIQPDEIKAAFKELDNNDIILGPTFDGGYYLIGKKRLYEQLFNDRLRWGNKSVFETTVDIANILGLSVGLVEKHRDIDTKEDLLDFKNRMENEKFKGKFLPENTIKFIKKHWSDEYYVKRYIKR